MPRVTRLVRAGSGIADGWRWWIHELRLAAAEFVDARSGFSCASFTVTPGQDGFVLRQPTPVGEATEQWLSILPGMGGLPDQVHAVLTVPASAVLTYRFEFPAAARADLASAVRLKLERLSPVPLDRLYIAIGAPLVAGTVLQVVTELVRRESIDEWNRLLGDLNVSVVQAVSESGTPFRAHDERVRRTSGWLLVGLQPALVLSACIAIVMGAVEWQQRTEREADWVAHALLSVKAAAADEVAARHEWARKAAIVRAVQHGTPRHDPLALLNTLNERLPKDMWLQSFRYDGDGANVTVFVQSRADVGALLLDAPGIQTVTENDRVPLGIGIGSERVELHLGLRAEPRS